ncbi:ATP synthase subunit I [Lentibacillus cibarius]|uniref:ATP synthase subunit I n=1 Tax=Lentibacillus cibarius TaxID=2583219 RepID=A0A549YMR4_9BACI|nr:ATP synthase subunit I [Lentibacillus cibarius]TMN23822.1 ATP synthase subunit I [Lentibacillus cibarius]TRM13172.1 ATP synthase subunit I [Lentibacillus cibarius]
MSYYENMVSRQRKWMFYLLAIYVLGAGFTPYQQIFLGLLLGGCVSFYNLWLLQRKIDAFAASTEKNESAGGLGSISRLAAAALAVLIALRFDAYFNVISVLVGLMTSYLVIVIDFFMSRFQKG